MTDKQLVDIEPYVTSEIPAVSRPQMILALRKAARKFCQITLLAERTETFTVAAGTSMVSIADIQGYDFIRLIEARWNTDQPLALSSSDQLDLENPTFHWHGSFENNVIAGSDLTDWRQRTGPPRAIISDMNGALIIAPIPESEGTLTVKYAIQPNIAGTALDDFIVNSYFETLAEGAIAVLLRIPKKDWTDVRAGISRWNDFERMVKDIRSDRLKGFKRDDQSVSRVRSHY